MNATAEVVTEKSVIQLAPGQESLATFEYASSRYDATIPKGVSIENLQDPSFWAHHAFRLKPFDEIRARAEDGSWMANFVVLDCARTWARVHMLAKHDLTAPAAISSRDEVEQFKSDHEVLFRGPHKWSLVRKSDRTVLEQDIETKGKANLRLEELARSIVGAPKT